MGIAKKIRGTRRREGRHRGESPGGDKTRLVERQGKFVLGVLKRWVPEQVQCVSKENRIENTFYQGPVDFLNALQSHLGNRVNGIPYKLFLERDSGRRQNRVLLGPNR